MEESIHALESVRLCQQVVPKHAEVLLLAARGAAYEPLSDAKDVRELKETMVVYRSRKIAKRLSK